MELVIDATILFIGLIGKGVTKEIIFSKSVRLYCPEVLFNEAEEHKSRIKILSGLSSAELEALLGKLKGAIRIFPRHEYEEFLKEANNLISDPDDTEYLALSLALNKCPIWSNDPHFKEQSLVKVFTTEELVKSLKSQKLFWYSYLFSKSIILLIFLLSILLIFSFSLPFDRQSRLFYHLCWAELQFCDMLGQKCLSSKKQHFQER